MVIAPSNPPLSIWPILAVPGIREAVAAARVAAVSPLFGGKALKGPADRVMATLGLAARQRRGPRRVRGPASTCWSSTSSDRVDEGLSTAATRVVATDTRIAEPEAAARFAAWLIEEAAVIEIHPLARHPRDRTRATTSPPLIAAALDSQPDSPRSPATCWWSPTRSSPRPKERCAILEGEEDPAYRALVEDEAAEILRRRGDLVIAKTRHGFICANAGVDRSNTAPGTAVLLPRDPDRSAHTLRIGTVAGSPASTCRSSSPTPSAGRGGADSATSPSASRASTRSWT